MTGTRLSGNCTVPVKISLMNSAGITGRMSFPGTGYPNGWVIYSVPAANRGQGERTDAGCGHKTVRW